MAKIKGIDKAVRNLRAMGPKGERYLKAILSSTAYEIVTQAKQNAPKDIGTLAQSIGKQVADDGMKVGIFINADHWAFVEFGTKTYVSVPGELAEVAKEYKGLKKGNFDDFLQAIKDWCRRKGIDEKYAYPICISILRKGIKPQPFFYPALQKGKAGIVKKLRAATMKLKREQ